MSTTDKIVLARFKEALFDLLDETFVEHHGIYLDRHTSLFETLDGISAEEASRPVSATCAPLSAQVAHVRFYIDVLEEVLHGREVGRVDWGEIWRTVGEVTPEEWEGLKQQLHDSYERVLALLHEFDSWEGEEEIGGAMAILVHSAYHLGEIRQALCFIQPTTGDK
jgi:hypothetical protein